MAKFRDGMFGPTVILFAICLVMTFALAATNSVTAPIIAAQRLENLKEVMQLVLPAADYTLIESGLPEEVELVAAAADGSGYVVQVDTKGFDGNVTWVVGVNAAGEYVGINMFEHTETAGLGSRVGEPDYLEQYYGKNDPDAVDSISGATLTSNSLKEALALVNDTYASIS